jgi:hypothetical protein
VGGVPIEETLAALGPALFVVVGVARAKLRGARRPRITSPRADARRRAAPDRPDVGAT